MECRFNDECVPQAVSVAELSSGILKPLHHTHSLIQGEMQSPAGLKCPILLVAFTP